MHGPDDLPRVWEVVLFWAAIHPADGVQYHCPSSTIRTVIVAHRHQAARRYASVFLKSLFYLHVLRRYNLPAEQRAQQNLLVLWVDEAQRFVTTSRSGYGEQAVVDLVREAQCALVLATQSTTSLVAPLGRDVAKIIALNMRNLMCFKAADQEDAEEAAARLGKRKKREEWTAVRPRRQANASSAILSKSRRRAQGTLYLSSVIRADL